MNTDAAAFSNADVLAPSAPADPRIASIVNLTGFEAVARERMHPIAYDYVAGGAWDELSIAENLAAWRRRWLRPRVLVDVSNTDTSTTALGRTIAMPVAIAPMAAHALAHVDAESATARAAAAAGVPFTLSTVSSHSIEDVAAAAPDALRWFQLYTQPDPQLSRSLVERAEAAGYRAIVLTVDLPVLGYRERDRRNGFDLSIPLGNFAGGRRGSNPRESGFAALNAQRKNALGWADIDRMRAWSRLPFVLKGVLTAEDARLAAGHGVDAIVVSNHGARQLDRSPAPIDVLEEVVEAVDGRVEVWVDGGVRRGLDVVMAIALGARGVLVGRPFLYALAAGGEAGVARALAILREELELALTLVGAPTPADVVRSHVRP